MTFQIKLTRKDGTLEWTEIEAGDKMTVATHIIADIRSIGWQENDPTIAEVRYNEKGTTEYRYA